MLGSAPRIAVVGAGIGGLAVAASLQRRGGDVQVYEQASRFHRLGAGIQMSPNAMRVHRELGLEGVLREKAFEPRAWSNRDWDTGATKFDLTLAPEVEPRYGAPYLLMHRGDLHEALASAVPPDLVHLGKRLVELEEASDGMTLRFADGSSATADAVIGADGVHSRGARRSCSGPRRRPSPAGSPIGRYIRRRC